VMFGRSEFFGNFTGHFLLHALPVKVFYTFPK
jgi:hypothetical protein